MNITRIETFKTGDENKVPQTPDEFMERINNMELWIENDGAVVVFKGFEIEEFFMHMREIMGY